MFSDISSDIIFLLFYKCYTLELNCMTTALTNLQSQIKIDNLLLIIYNVSVLV